MCKHFYQTVDTIFFNWYLVLNWIFNLKVIYKKINVFTIVQSERNLPQNLFLQVNRYFEIFCFVEFCNKIPQETCRSHFLLTDHPNQDFYLSKINLFDSWKFPKRNLLRRNFNDILSLFNPSRDEHVVNEWPPIWITLVRR